VHIQIFSRRISLFGNKYNKQQTSNHTPHGKVVERKQAT